MPRRRPAPGGQEAHHALSGGLQQPERAGALSPDLKAMLKPSRSKYGNHPVWVDGIRFASKRESARYKDLALASIAGRISDLQRQVRFDLHAPNGDVVGRYVADFTYRLVAPGLATDGQMFVEDAKGVRTQLYIWKKRHFEAEYGLTILEV